MVGDAALGGSMTVMSVSGASSVDSLRGAGAGTIGLSTSITPPSVSTRYVSRESPVSSLLSRRTLGRGQPSGHERHEPYNISAYMTLGAS